MNDMPSKRPSIETSRSNGELLGAVSLMEISRDHEREEGRLREHVEKWTALEDLVICGILRSECEAARRSAGVAKSKF